MCVREDKWSRSDDLMKKVNEYGEMSNFTTRNVPELRVQHSTTASLHEIKRFNRSYLRQKCFLKVLLVVKVCNN